MAMVTTSNSVSSSQLAHSQAAQDAAILAMQKQAQANQSQSALGLINGVPQHPEPVQNPSNLPPNLGQNVNTTA